MCGFGETARLLLFAVARQILKIPIKPENLLYWALDRHACFDRIFVPRR